MKSCFPLFFILLFGCLFAQQTPRFTQFTLNTLGQNPAYAGTNPTQLEFIAGRRQQWIGFQGAPTTTFFGCTYGYRGTYNYKGYHGFSVYMESDNVAGLKNDSYYLGYAYHIKLVTGINLGFGIMVGGRSFSMSSRLSQMSDPAFMSSQGMVKLYPDFIPGFRIYSKRFFMDFSVRQLYKNRLQQGSFYIGKNARLSPHYYFTFGRKFKAGYKNYLIVPALHIQSNLLSAPQLDANMLIYFKRRVGLGINYRLFSTFSAIFQVNIFKNAFFGISYDYSANRFRHVAANSIEVMFGMSPLMGEESSSRKKNGSKSPSFDY